MSGSYPMSTIASQIEKRAKSCGYSIPHTPGDKIHKRNANLWECVALVDSNGDAVGSRFFYIERGHLKMTKEKPWKTKRKRRLSQARARSRRVTYWNSSIAAHL